MRGAHVDDRGRFVLPGGGGAGYVIGPLMIAGGFALQKPGIDKMPERPDVLLFCLVVGAVLVLGGFAALLGVTRTIIHKEEGKILSWRGLLWFGSEQEQDLGSPQLVNLFCNPVKHKHGEVPYFELRIDCGGRHVEVTRSYDGILMRQAARQLAEYLGVEVAGYYQGRRLDRLPGE